MDGKKTGFGSRRLHAEPANWYDWSFSRLTELFPGKATFTLAGSWKNSENAAEDTGGADDTEEHRGSPNGQITGHMSTGRKRPGKDSSIKKRVHNYRATKSLHGQLHSESANARRQKEPWEKKMKGWQPLSPFRRLLDPTMSFEKSEKPQVPSAPHYSGSASESDRRLRITRPEFSSGGWIPYAFSADDAWEYIVPIGMPEVDVISLIDSWEKGQIFDESTKFVAIELLTVNDNLHQGLVSHTFIDFLFSRGGHIYVEVIVQSLVRKSSMLAAGLGFLWIITLLGNTIGTPARTFAAFRRGKLRSHLKRFSNLLEWCLTIFGWCIVLAFIQERFCMRKFNKQLKDYGQDREAFATNDPALLQFDTREFQKIQATVLNEGNLDTWLLLFVGYYHVLLILRFVVASRGQPRIAIVINTIYHSATDLLHLFFVGSIIVISYVVAGHILFGKRVEPFSTLEGSLAYTLRIMLAKEFDFQRLTTEDFWTVCIWVYTFVILVVLVLVNIVLAMIFDTYGEVRGTITKSDSIMATIKRIAVQMRLGNAWVSNKQLLSASRKVPTPVISAHQLKEALPGIGKEQVRYIYEQCESKVQNMMTAGNKNALPEAIASVLIGISTLQDGLKVVRTGVPPPKYQICSRKTRVLLEESVPAHSSSALDLLGDSDNFVTTESGQPFWVKQALVPYLRTQGKFLEKLCDELASTEAKLQSQGIGQNIDPCPYPEPGLPWEDNPDIIEPFAKSLEERRKEAQLTTPESFRCVSATAPPSILHRLVG